MLGNKILVWIVLSFTILNTSRSKRHGDKDQKCPDGEFDVVKKGSQLKGRISEVIEQLCLPARTDRLVYRFKNESHIRIDFDVVSENKMFSISWDITRENPEILYGKNKLEIYPADERRPYIPAHLLLAATNEGQQKRFLNNLRSCQDSSFVSLTCVIQSFSSLARRMKEVSIVTDKGKV